MVEEPAKTLRDMVKRVGRYPEDAFLFVREGLAFAADSIHGAESEAHRALQEFLAEQNLDWDDLIGQYHNDALPEAVVEAIDELGGCDNLNRHVGGREFCWALRDYAINRWGILAQTVLENWRITNTKDFGRIVFGFIDYDLMRKQADDRLEDFEDVFSFDEAFDTPFGEKPKPNDPSPPRH